MSEIRIKTAPVLREVKIWALIFVVTCLIHAYAISNLEGQWSELYTQLHIILILSLVYYLTVALLRGIAFLIGLGMRLIIKPNRKPAGNSQPHR